MSWAAKAVEVQDLYTFPPNPVPNSVLLQDSSGAFYGTTSGGEFGDGTIYRVTTNGTIQTLVTFDGTNGSSPNVPLVLGSDGDLYGTTTYGGNQGGGTVFRLTTNGDLTTLACFDYFTNGNEPEFGLIQGNDGAFYGATTSGGPTFGGSVFGGNGTVFRVTTNGELTVVAPFGNLQGTNQSSFSPSTVLALENDGSIYGASTLGGSNNAGEIFRVNTNGTLSTLASFADTNGQKSKISLMAGGNGMLYGTTMSYAGQGGTSVSSVSSSLFQVSTNGDLVTVAVYTNELAVNAGLAQSRDGILYGVSSSYSLGTNQYGGAIIRWDTGNQSVTVLPITNWDVYAPQTSMIFGQDGALYGTMQGGDYNYGAVVRVTTNGELTVVASFQFANSVDMLSGLVEAADGIVYGTSFDGGSNNFGTLYSITSDGTFRTLVDFDSENGAYPSGDLVAGEDGSLYGTTYSGGVNSAGTMFKFTTNGVLTTLVSFDYTNIGTPVTGLTRGNDDSFYGITSIYDLGSSNIETLFRVSTNGELKPLASFSGTNFISSSDLSLGADGAFYGTTYTGGIYNTGTVFRVTTNGNFTTLISFDGTNGANPESALVLGEDGAFYGTTTLGGIGNRGTIFRMTTDGNLNTLVSFGATQAWGYPSVDLVPDGRGAFYGNAGQLFRVTTNGILTLLGSYFAGGSGALTYSSDGWYYGTKGYYVGGLFNSIYRMNPSVRMLSLTRGGKSWNVHFNGIPGDSYQVQRATTLLGPWETLTNAATDSNGDGHFNDGQPPVERAFYRMKTP